MSNGPSVGVSKFFEKISPGGKYFKYSLGLLMVLVLTVTTLATMIVLPLLTGGKYQNPVSQRSQKILAQLGAVPSPTTQPIMTPCPGYHIPTGKQQYQWSHGPDVVGPKIGTMIIDPLDPSSGQKQTITVTIKNDSPVTSAGAILLTDNSEQKGAFKLKDGSTTDGTWELTWQTRDSYKCQYAIRFDLKSTTGNYNEVMRIR